MTADIRLDPASQAARVWREQGAAVTAGSIESRPRLPRPDEVTRTERLSQKELTCAILETVLAIHEASLQNRKEQFDGVVDNLRKEQERLELESQEAARRHKTSGFWGFLKKVAVYVFAGVSIVVGGVMAAMGGPAGVVAGSLMMASGAASITSQILADANINSQLTGALAISGAIIGLVGTGVSFSVLANSLPTLIATIAASVAKVTEGSMTIGTAIAMSEANKIDAKVIDLKGKVSLDQTDMQWISDTITRETKKLIEGEMQVIQSQSELLAFTANIGKTALQA